MDQVSRAVVAAKVRKTPWKSAKLLNHCLLCLRGVFALAGGSLKMDNPIEGIENCKHQILPPDALSTFEMEKVLARLKERLDIHAWAYFEFAFMTGMCPEELI